MHSDPKEGPIHTRHEELIVDAAALDDLALEELTDVRVVPKSALLDRIKEDVALALGAATALGSGPIEVRHAI